MLAVRIGQLTAWGLAPHEIRGLAGRSPDDYLVARNALIHKDLIAFDGLLFQVLSLPDRPVGVAPPSLRPPEQMPQADPATIHQIIRQSLGVDHD